MARSASPGFHDQSPTTLRGPEAPDVDSWEHPRGVTAIGQTFVAPIKSPSSKSGRTRTGPRYFIVDRVCATRLPSDWRIGTFFSSLTFSWRRMDLSLRAPKDAPSLRCCSASGCACPLKSSDRDTVPSQVKHRPRPPTTLLIVGPAPSLRYFRQVRPRRDRLFNIWRDFSMRPRPKVLHPPPAAQETR